MTIREILLATAAIGAVLFPVAPAAAEDISYGRVDVRAQGLTAGGFNQHAASVENGDAAGTAAASGSLRDGKVHATATSSPNGVTSCQPWDYYCYWNAEAAVGMWERVTFSADEANSMDGVLDYSFDFDGHYDNGRWWGGGNALGSWYVGDYYFGMGLSMLDWHNLDPKFPTHIAGSLNINDGATIYIALGLSVSARDGASMDYGNTGKFSWTVPAGYHFTSSSGEFMADAVGTVPEPATWAMLIAGFGGIGAALRRGRARGAAPLRSGGLA